MKWTKYIAVLLIALYSCNSHKPEQKTDKKIITVSILPEKYFVEKIAGDHYKINVMIPPMILPVPLLMPIS